MIRSIERFWRLVKGQPALPVAMIVVGAHMPPDPVRRGTGYAGVLVVPTSATPAAPATTKTDTGVGTDQIRRDVRAARGRVLYANGHAPQATSQRAERKVACPERRVGQVKPAPASPTL